MLSPGKYDPEAEKLLSELQARGLILIVVHGNKGTGMSVKSDPILLSTLPGVLRHTADMIESEVSRDVQEAMRRS